MGTLLETLRSRVDVSVPTAVLAVGDLVAIAAFVVIGSVDAHGGSLSNVVGLTETAIPFVVGWTFAALLGNLYAVDARRSVLRAISLTIPAWITAALIAQVLRGVLPTPGSFSPVLLLVSIVAGLVLLLPWRGATAYWLSGQLMR